MARIIVEYAFDPPRTPDELAADARRIDECLAVRDGAWRRSSVAPTGRHMVCEFEAPDAECVREALRSASVPFVRVWTADVYDAADYPDHKAKLDEVVARLEARAKRG